MHVSRYVQFATMHKMYLICMHVLCFLIWLILQIDMYINCGIYLTPQYTSSLGGNKNRELFNTAIFKRSLSKWAQFDIPGKNKASIRAYARL